MRVLGDTGECCLLRLGGCRGEVWGGVRGNECRSVIVRGGVGGVVAVEVVDRSRGGNRVRSVRAKGEGRGRVVVLVGGAAE